MVARSKEKKPKTTKKPEETAKPKKPTKPKEAIEKKPKPKENTRSDKERIDTITSRLKKIDVLLKKPVGGEKKKELRKLKTSLTGIRDELRSSQKPRFKPVQVKPEEAPKVKPDKPIKRKTKEEVNLDKIPTDQSSFDKAMQELSKEKGPTKTITQQALPKPVAKPLRQQSDSDNFRYRKIVSDLYPRIDFKAQGAIENYMAASFDLNNQLRNRAEGEIDPDNKKWAKDLDRAFENVPEYNFPDLYRGGSIGKDELANLTVGDTITDKGFVSTTIKEKTGRRYALKPNKDRPDLQPVVYKFNAGRMKGLPPSSLSEDDEEEEDRASLVLNEDEVMLPRNSSFKVVDIIYRDNLSPEIVMDIVKG